MENKGSNVKNRSSAFSYIRNLKEFKQLTREEKNVEKKKQHQFIFWSQILLIPIYLIGMILIINFTF